MSGTPEISLFRLGLVVAGAAVLLGVLLVARFLVRVVPRSRATRERLERLSPAVGLVGWVAYVLVAAAWLLHGHRVSTLAVVAIVAVLLVGAAWFALRDYVAGVILRSEGGCRAGDRVRVGETEGLVRHLGFRVIQIELPEGDLVLIPYTRLSLDSLVRGERSRGATHHTFLLEIPPHAEISAARRAARRSALLCHWIAPHDDPQIRAKDARVLEVTVHPLADERAADVERAVRAAVAALGARGRS